MKTYKLGLTGREVAEKFAQLDELIKNPTTGTFNSTNSAFGTCSTGATTPAKVITITNPAEGWTLENGSRITVKSTTTNSASNPTLNVNSTGAKSVYYNGSKITNINTDHAGYSSRLIDYIYDSELDGWVFMGWSYDIDNNTTAVQAEQGQGYGTCSTAAATTTKAVTLSGYALKIGGIVSVKFTNSVPAGATMNINNKGAKSIYYRGAAITADIIKAGDTATFMCDGSTRYQLISIDRWQNDITECKNDIGDISTALTNIISQTEAIIGGN
jgi:hypothetical protein